MTEITARPTLNTAASLVTTDLSADAWRQEPSPIQQHQKESKTQQQSVIFNSLFAGSLAGMVSCFIFHPLDVVRTKIQTGSFESLSKKSASKFAPNKIGPMATMSHTFQNGGVRALYTGLSLPLMAQAVYKATIFTTNRETKRYLLECRGISSEASKTYRFTLAEYFACGAVGGFINSLFFVCPVEFVRSQLIAQHTRMAASNTNSLQSISNPKNGPLDVIQTTFRKDGISGLWRGAGVTVIRDSIGCGAFFLAYEIALSTIPRYTGTSSDARPTIFTTMGAGSMAGLAYWGVSMPLDSLKTLVQSGTAESARGALKLLVKREGSLGACKRLYMGWQVAFGRGMPSAAMSILTYSTAYDYISQKSKHVV